MILSLIRIRIRSRRGNEGRTGESFMILGLIFYGFLQIESYVSIKVMLI